MGSVLRGPMWLLDGQRSVIKERVRKHRNIRFDSSDVIRAAAAPAPNLTHLSFCRFTSTSVHLQDF